MGRQKWYVVIVGRDVGVFQTWIDVAPLVTGVSGAVHQSFSSESEAEAIFAQALDQGKVKIVGAHTASAAASPPRPNPSPRPHPEVTGPVHLGREYESSPSLRPLATSSATGRNSRSVQGSTVPIKSEVTEGTSASLYQISSSPPTGVTQIVALPSGSESAVLSPLILSNNELEPDNGSGQPVQAASLGRASSEASGSGRMTAPTTVQLSSSENSLPTTTVVHTVHHIHHHIHHYTHPNTPVQTPNTEQNFESLSSQMAALGLSQDTYVSGPSRAADPRSPLRQTSLVPLTIPSLSRRPSPSPRMSGEGTLFSND